MLVSVAYRSKSSVALKEEASGMETGADGLWVDQLRVGRLAVFSYVVTDPVSREAAIVDPGAEPGRILGRVQERGARVRWMIFTHAHPDHVAAGGILESRLEGVQVALHEDEARRMRRWWHPLLIRFLGGKAVRKADRLVEDGERLPLGARVLEVLHTPGHTSGSVCLYCPGHLFTGDTLFVGGVGRTDLPGGSVGDLARSLRGRILPLPGETRIWPGHDYGPVRSSRLEEELRSNPFVKGLAAGRERGPG